VSLLFIEHIETLRQYILSDDLELKNQLLDTIPSDFKDTVVSIQKYFEENIDAEAIAGKIGASEFQGQLEELQSLYQFKRNGIDEQVFENELNAALTSTERNALKKRLIEIDSSEVGEFSENELKSALTLVERKFLKEKFQQLDEVLWEDRDLKFKGKASLTESLSPKSVADYRFEEDAPIKIAASRSKYFSTYVKYAVAACVVLAIGIGVYQYTKQDSGPENILADSSDKPNLNQNKDELPVIETLPIAEISTTNNSYSVLKSGLGYGEVEEKVSVMVNNQKNRILSVEKAISGYADQLKKIQNPEAEQVISDLKSRISSLESELAQLNSREKQYDFDGKVLKLYTTSANQEYQILRLGADFYLSFNGKFYKMSIAKEPQTLMEETDDKVLNALDKIIFNAD
jgi:hypothetical protein